MSQALGGVQYSQGGFPRVSGDEPTHRRSAIAPAVFSPRERG